MIETSRMIENEAGIVEYVETVRMFDFQRKKEQCCLDNPVVAGAGDADYFDQMEIDLDVEDVEIWVE